MRLKLRCRIRFRLDTDGSTLGLDFEHSHPCLQVQSLSDLNDHSLERLVVGQTLFDFEVSQFRVRTPEHNPKTHPPTLVRQPQTC